MTLQQDLRDTLAGVARAMGNGHRLGLLERLAQGDASVEALANATGLSVANASQHLQQLRRAGLATASRQGRQMLYRLTDARIIDLLGLLRQVAETNLAETERLVGQLFADDDASGALEPVSRSELLAGVESGRVAVLDVRPVEEFEAGHLPDAISMPLARLEDLRERLPRDREIVAYCRGPWCALSHEAVLRLRRDGYQVRRFEEGYPEWKAAGLPVSGGGRPAWATTS